MKDMKKQRCKARNRRNNLPQSIGRIIKDDYPELISPDIKISYNRNRKILSIRSEEGIPMKQMDGLFNTIINLRNKKYKETL